MSAASATSLRRARQVAPLFAALGDETRLGLLSRLSSGRPTSIAALSEHATISRQAIRKHLEVLADAGLVKGTREGREHLWTLEPARLADARGYLDAIGRQWDDALARLATFVEDDG